MHKTSVSLAGTGLIVADPISIIQRFVSGLIREAFRMVNECARKAFVPALTNI